MSDWLAELKDALKDRIHALLDAQRSDFERIAGPLGGECLEALAEYACRGKLLRGALVTIGCELCGTRAEEGELKDALLDIGAAMELLQSALLIHDDIMDRDRLRRGKPSVHARYEAILEEAGIEDSAHQGEALAICLGDIALFSAWHAIARVNMPPATVHRLSRAASLELNRVALAQMLDVANGAVKGKPLHRFFPAVEGQARFGEEALRTENIYRFKTGRYTFSLPLALGALAAGADGEKVKTLEEAGEELGVVFQVKDDELGLWAREEELGKSVGIDIREDKKTLHRLALFQALEPKALEGDGDAEAILASFGQGDAPVAAIDRVRTAMETLGIKESMTALMKAHNDHALSRLGSILASSTARARNEFERLLSWNLSRSS